MLYGQNFNHGSRNYHNTTAGSPAPLPRKEPTAAAQQQPAVTHPCRPSYVAARCGMAIPMFPVDMGIDIASVQAEIENCKRRYQRDVWNVICGKALQGPGGAAGGGSWKKPGEQHRDEDSAASAASGAGVTKQAPPESGHANATSTGGASTVGSRQGKSEENTTDEDHQQPTAGPPEAKSGEEEVTTDEAANENNLANRRLAARRRSTSTRRRQLSQGRPGGNNGNGSSGSRRKDDWRNFSNSTERRAATPQHRPNTYPTNVVEFSGQPLSQPLRTPGRRQVVDVITTQPQMLSERRNREEFVGGHYFDDDDSSEDDEEFNAGRRQSDLADNYSLGTSDSSGGADDFNFRRRFVPIFCGNWAEAGVGRASQRQMRSRLRHRSGLTVTYHEQMPTPASERSARL